MKLFFTGFALLAIVLAIYPFIDTPDDSKKLSGLPWQIEVINNDRVRVFGVDIGVSQLSDVIEILGKDMETAVISGYNETGSLEMYYGHYKAGLLSGKLIVQFSSREEDIVRWKKNAAKSEYMASGQAKRYIIANEDQAGIFQETVSGITFIPAINLDDEIILARFGQPAQRIEKSGVIHYLYPELGLDIALHEEGKEILQYVTPAHFSTLVTPLLDDAGN